MGKYLKMILVLSVISLASGLILGFLSGATRADIDSNVLRYKKVPAVMQICEAVESRALSDAEKDAYATELLNTRKTITVTAADGTSQESTVFVLTRDGKPYGVALEAEGQGYGGSVGVMTGINLVNGDYCGIGITTHSETPGVGSKVTEKAFRDQFTGLRAGVDLKIKKDGGSIDAVSGATFSSRAVSEAMRKATEMFTTNRQPIQTAIGQ